MSNATGKMRCTYHCGKRGNIKHNKHLEETKNASWDKEKTKDNHTVCLYQSDSNDYEKYELQMYEELFGETLEHQNARYIKKGNYKKIKSMEQWKEAYKNKPCETILQIGDRNSHADAETLEACVCEFVKWKSERCNEHYKALHYTVHLDESTPHIHLDEVYFYTDAHGDRRPGIKEAMRQLGIPLPKPDEEEGKNNYRKAVLDEECRGKWQEILIEHGLDIETEPDRSRSVGHMGIKPYKAYISSVEAFNAKMGRQQFEFNTKMNQQEAAFNAEMERQRLEFDEDEMMRKADLYLDGLEFDEKRADLEKLYQEMEALHDRYTEAYLDLNDKMREQERDRRIQAEDKFCNILDKCRSYGINIDVDEPEM